MNSSAGGELCCALGNGTSEKSPLCVDAAGSSRRVLSIRGEVEAEFPFSFFFFFKSYVQEEAVSVCSNSKNPYMAGAARAMD